MPMELRSSRKNTNTDVNVSSSNEGLLSPTLFSVSREGATAPTHFSEGATAPTSIEGTNVPSVLNEGVTTPVHTSEGVTTPLHTSERAIALESTRTCADIQHTNMSNIYGTQSSAGNMGSVSTHTHSPSLNMTSELSSDIRPYTSHHQHDGSGDTLVKSTYVTAQPYMRSHIDSDMIPHPRHMAHRSNSTLALQYEGTTVPSCVGKGTNVPLFYDGMNVPRDSMEGTNVPQFFDGTNVPRSPFEGTNVPQFFDGTNVPRSSFEGTNVPRSSSRGTNVPRRVTKGVDAPNVPVISEVRHRGGISMNMSSRHHGADDIHQQASRSSPELSSSCDVTHNRDMISMFERMNRENEKLHQRIKELEMRREQSIHLPVYPDAYQVRSNDATGYQRQTFHLEPTINTPVLPQPSSSYVNHRRDNIQPRLPIYNGRTNWEAFWVQFRLISDQQGWNEDVQCDRLILSLKDEALLFISQLPYETRRNINLLFAAMKRRFGDHVLAETHRATLQNMKKTSNETVQEYASRVTAIMVKAYPGLEGTTLFSQLAVEHLLHGLTDSTLAYDVMTKKPKSIEEAIDLIAWHDCCKVNAKRKPTSSIRHVAPESESDSDEDEMKDHHKVRRANGKSYVTEERLNQFGRDLKESIIKSVSETVSKEVSELKKMRESNSNYQQNRNNREQPQYRRKGNQYGNSTRKCFTCNLEGHYSYNCPQKNQKDAANNTQESSSEQTNTKSEN